LRFLNLTILSNLYCNFNCTYCYEKNKFKNSDISNETINKIISLLDVYLNNRKLRVTLIGGEPTLSKNLPLLIKKLEKYNPEYLLITNGSNFENILKLFDDQIFKRKIRIQISYDGKVINDKERIIKKHNSFTGTSVIILKTLDELINFKKKNKLKNITIDLKPTLDVKYLNLVPEAIKEFRELSLKYKQLFNYGVSEVKESIINLSKDEIRNLIQESFPRILKEEKENFKIFKKPLSAWLQKINFDKPSEFCSAGIDSITINYEGELLYCHRCQFYNNSSLRFGKIENPQETIKTIKEKKSYLLQNKDKFIDQCENCSAIYCQKCPAEFAEINNESIENIYNSWDYNKTKNICFYYQEISKYLYIFWKKYLK